MNLEQLNIRAQEIATAIENMSAQLNALHGHKAETAHWIQKLQAPIEENENPVESESVQEVIQ